LIKDQAGGKDKQHAMMDFATKHCTKIKADSKSLCSITENLNVISILENDNVLEWVEKSKSDKSKEKLLTDFDGLCSKLRAK